jgi:transketolase
VRSAFVETLVSLAEEDPRILLLTGDLGFMALEPFAQRFPDRFLNVGVAEQNMIGLATGLAEAGYRPFVYSIATFAALRGYEFIRNGPILHNLPVRIVGMGGGFDYGSAGTTHHALDDVGALRVQPGLSIIAPADGEQARAALRAMQEIAGPVYLRLGKDDRLTVPGLDGRFALGRAERLRDGADVLLISMGNATVEAVAAAEMLAGANVECAVLNVASIKPAPIDDLCDALSRVRFAVTVEAHYDVGALGSLVSEVVASRGLACRVARCAVHEAPDGIAGSARFLMHRHGISREGVVAIVLENLVHAGLAPRRAPLVPLWSRP